jgi:two-component system cell cycle sensor histidine kinase/response regulator CckA
MPVRETSMPGASNVRIWSKRPSPVAGYATAVALSLLAHLARPFLLPHMLIPYGPSIVIAGAIGGLGPGLLATLLCALESLYFAAEPVRDIQNGLGIGALLITGIVASLVFEELKSDGERLRRAYSELAAFQTESKLAEDKLGAANRQMSSILESISDGFNVFDREWRYVYVNPAAARMVHKRPDELLGKNVWELWPHAWDSPFGVAYRRAVEENVPVQVESFYPEPLNAWFEVRCYPSPEGLSLFFTDVTERKRADQELRESQERLSLVIKATGLGTFDWFPKTGKIVWSESARMNLGVPPDAPASYETFLRAVHPADRDRVNDIVRHVLRRDRSGHYETEYRTIGLADHVVRWVSAWGTVFFDEAGLPERLLGVTLDITARKRLEEQFRQAQKLESVGRLAGGVAHDFNNLLTVIMGYGQMLLADLPAEDPMRESLAEIAHAASRAEELTRQLLAFSRNQISEPKNIVLNETLRNFEKMLGRLLGEDVTVSMSLAPEAGVIRADPGQIEQVVMNLAVNARDAMPQGGRLVIETSAIVADEQFAQAHFGVSPGPYVVLSVSDTGVGMSPEVKAHIFEPFFTTKEQGKGTGLGLSTVYGIVRQAGAAISVYSEPGHGTTFKFFFPSVEGPADSAPAALPASLPVADATILLAEDEPTVRLYTQRILERQGYTVLPAGNGAVAMEVARQYPGQIHLLLADIIMPVMGGGELAREFAAVRPGIPVLCMSGYADELSPPPQHMIQKPFTPSALLSRIHELLSPVES